MSDGQLHCPKTMCTHTQTIWSSDITDRTPWARTGCVPDGQLHCPKVYFFVLFIAVLDAATEIGWNLVFWAETVCGFWRIVLIPVFCIKAKVLLILIFNSFFLLCRDHRMETDRQAKLARLKGLLFSLQNCTSCVEFQGLACWLSTKMDDWVWPMSFTSHPHCVMTFPYERCWSQIMNINTIYGGKAGFAKTLKSGFLSSFSDSLTVDNRSPWNKEFVLFGVRRRRDRKSKR